MQPYMLDRFAHYGYTLENLGGNCTALRHTDGDMETLITSEVWEGYAPERWAEKVVVSEGAAGESETNDTHGYTLSECLAALANPSTEYTLLSLRLFNGFHKADA